MLETKTIDSIGYSKTHPNFRSLTHEVDSLSKRFDRLGYLQHESLGVLKLNDSTFEATFNLNRRFNSVRLFNKEIIPTAIYSQFNLAGDKDYVEIDIGSLENFLSQINEAMANQGQPFSEVRLKTIEITKNGMLRADLYIQRSKERKIDKIVVKGYENFPRSYLRHNLKIRNGQLFSMSNIERKMKKLQNLRFAKEIKSPEVLFTNDSTHLYIYVEKVKQNVFDGFLGFGTNETTDKLEFDGYLNLALNNNLNFGESFELYYKSDENEQKTFDANISMPYILSSPIGIELSLNIFKRDSSFLNVDQTAKINYQFSSVLQSGIGISASSSSDLLDMPLTNIKDFKSTFALLDVSLNIPKTTSMLFPTKSQVYMYTKIGNRTYDAFKDEQLKFGLDAFNIFYLNPKNSIYVRFTAQHLDSDSLLENELSRFGGINSIRGFEENSLLANTFGVINTEYRYELSPSLYIHSLIDAAYFENRLAAQKSKLYGLGFGFGLLTNAGLFKLTYANGKTEDQKIRFSDSKIHLSLTARF